MGVIGFVLRSFIQGRSEGVPRTVSYGWRRALPGKINRPITPQKYTCFHGHNTKYVLVIVINYLQRTRKFVLRFSDIEFRIGQLPTPFAIIYAFYLRTGGKCSTSNCAPRHAQTNIQTMRLVNCFPIQYKPISEFKSTIMIRLNQRTTSSIQSAISKVRPKRTGTCHTCIIDVAFINPYHFSVVGIAIKFGSAGEILIGSAGSKPGFKTSARFNIIFLFQLILVFFFSVSPSPSLPHPQRRRSQRREFDQRNEFQTH